ncbi:hypothetical protein C9374_006953 [Naegleria lovaniensis]|uniref:Guanine nucleotide-binding protein subunit beta-like protein n=1 Tax=Naegleria lovaniensis TaxID=51637 RepID=A0AA88H624_NAELO|nr:uncharacterized protein C9374_006953 [Naegleria lovaniensis]KAG2393422.1 hypothetical protein C9374_006953 [Naegleria lovaniensis]
MSSFNGLPLAFGKQRNTASKTNASSSSDSSSTLPSSKQQYTKKAISILPQASTKSNAYSPAISKTLKSHQEEQKPMVFTQVRHFEEVEEDDEDEMNEKINSIDESDEHQSSSTSTVDATSQHTSTFKEFIPCCSHSVKMKGHKKAVTALAIDPSGSRLISGSSDYALKFWDFQGMDESLQPFKSIDEVTRDGSYAIKHLEFSNSGDKFILSDNSLQAILYNRDGQKLGRFKKGDTYIVDMSKTTGHTASWTGVKWHPDASNRFVLSSSMDCTLRVWDMEYFNSKGHKSVYKTRNSKGIKTPCTSCCYNNAGNLMVAGCSDGSIQIWKDNSNGNKSDIYYAPSQKQNASSCITCVSFLTNDQTLMARDETSLQIFDLRAMNSPLAVCSNLPNYFENSNCVESPLGNYIACVTSSIHEKDHGHLMIYDYKSNEMVHELDLGEGVSGIQLRWHPIINQIFVAASDHCITGYYDDVGFDLSSSTTCSMNDSISSSSSSTYHHSIRGLVTSMSRGIKKKNIDQAQMLQPQIIAPFASGNRKPLRKGSKKQIQQQEQQDAKYHKPTNQPPQGPGFGGRINDSFTHFLMKGMGVVHQNSEHENAREAILKHAEQAEKNPLFIAPAYQHTQPKPIFAYEEEEEDNEDGDHHSMEHFTENVHDRFRSGISRHDGDLEPSQKKRKAD